MEHAYHGQEHAHPNHEAHEHGHRGDHGGGHGDGHQEHHARMVADFRRRFWASLALTLPVLALAPLIQRLLGVEEAWSFPGDSYVQFSFATMVFFYGGWPFLKGLFDELGKRQPGMMTLIAVAITTAYAYSSTVVFGLAGKVFFWELVTLVDIMLLGHWIEMKSVMGASKALEELARLMPAEAHELMPDGSIKDVPLGELTVGDTYPHALGLAVPLVVAVSTAISARNGLLIRDRAAFERARNIQAIIFDKTGTLTQGEFGVTDLLVFDDDTDDRELLKYAASVEARSEHPIARGIVSSSEETFPIKGFRAIPGKGAEGRVNGREVKVVSPGYLKEQNVSITDGEVEKLSSQGKTVIFVMMDGELKGAIALADIIRPESQKAISMLKEMGIRCMMLTGDNKQVAQWVSEEIGLDEYFAEVLPAEKAAKVKEVLYNYGILLSPAVGALLMSLSTVIVAINARFLRIVR